MSLPSIKHQINNLSYFLPGVTWVEGGEKFGWCELTGEIFLRRDLLDNPIVFNLVFRHEVDHWVQIVHGDITILPPKKEFVDMMLLMHNLPTDNYKKYLLDSLEWEVHLRDFLHLAMLQGMTSEDVLESNFHLPFLPQEISYLNEEQFLLFRLMNFNNSLLKQIVDLWWEE